MRAECHAGRAGRSHRRGLHRQLRQPVIAAPHHDEGPVCKLCGAEDDRCRRVESAQDPYAQDTATHLHIEEIYLRETHPGQTREILFEEQHRSWAHRSAR